MEIKIYTDGGSLNNPGPAAIAYIIYYDDKIFHKHSETIGKATNNTAEYIALIRAMEKIKELLPKLPHTTKITVFSDSNLMVNQLNGLFRVKNAAIREYIMKVRILEQEINIPTVYQYVPREKNFLADSLVKEKLK